MASRKYKDSEVVIMAFLQNIRTKDIAKAANISTTTVSRLRADEEFQIILKDRRRQLQTAAVGRLSASLDRNLNHLQQIADDASISPQIRINAIQVLLRQYNEWSERADIIDRIEKLENQLASNRNKLA